jgi:acetyl-CoA acetyltransferase
VSTLPVKDATAITGIGWTAFTRDSQATVLSLASEASLKAIRDAGLAVPDIEGIVTFCWGRDTISPNDLARALGVQQCNYQAYDDLGGGWACAAVASAAMAIYAGLCQHVLVYRAAKGRSERPEREPGSAGRGRSQFTAPFGATHAAVSLGHQVTAHMARFGTTTLDFAHLAVTQRHHATLNQKAMMRAPMTIEEHQQSPWIVYPFRLLDCCLQSDGAVALVVSAADRARDLRHEPVYVSSMMGGTTPTHNPWETHAVGAAPKLYAGAGITARDLDLAEIYDPFTGMCLLQIEGFGLAEEGGAGAWIRAGENGLDGETPVNTHGGLLSEAYINGLNHVIEAVQQLRPGGVVDDLCEGPHDFDRAHCRQVRDPHVALVSGEAGDSSLILTRR